MTTKRHRLEYTQKELEILLREFNANTPLPELEVILNEQSESGHKREMNGIGQKIGKLSRQYPNTWNPKKAAEYARQRYNLVYRQWHDQHRVELREPWNRNRYKRKVRQLLENAQNIPDIGYKIGSVKLNYQQLRITIQEPRSDLCSIDVIQDFKQVIHQQNFIYPTGTDFTFYDTTLSLSLKPNIGRNEPYVLKFFEVYARVLAMQIGK